MSQSIYALRLKNLTVDAMAELLPRLVAAPFSATVKIERVPAGGDLRAQFSLVHTSGAQFDYARHYWLQGAMIGSDWVVELNSGKVWLRKHYGDTLGIPERIPPFSETVRSWSDQKILSEISSGFSNLHATG